MLFRECNHMWQAESLRCVRAGPRREADRQKPAARAKQIRTAYLAGSGGGFTLIEMAIVALVIMIVIAVALPFVIHYMRLYRLGIAGRSLATALQRARYLATSDNTRAEISIRRDEGMIDILEYSPDGTGTPQQKGLVTLPPDIRISPDAPNKIAFDGRGVITPLPKQSPVIEVSGVNGCFSTVTVSLTGQVTVSNIATRK